jgi:hypothetical protein
MHSSMSLLRKILFDVEQNSVVSASSICSGSGQLAIAQCNLLLAKVNEIIHHRQKIGVGELLSILIRP